MKKLNKILVLGCLGLFTFTSCVIVSPSNHVEAKFSFSSSGSRTSGSGFSFSRPSSTSSSRTGTFRTQTTQRNAVLNRTQSKVNRNVSNSMNRNSYSQPSYFRHNSFMSNMVGGMFGGMMSHMIFGRMFGGGGGYYGGNGYFAGGAYESGPGFFMSGIFNLIFWIIILILGFKILKWLFRSSRTNQTPIYNNQTSSNVSQVVQDNNDEFDEQRLELTKQDAKNYIQNLPISAEEKLNYISKVDKMFNEEEIVNFVENIERELDSEINISVEEGKAQGIDYVKTQMNNLTSEQKESLINKISIAKSLNEIEQAIAVFEK